MSDILKTDKESVKKLIQSLEKINLSENWIIAVLALSAQEIAIKKKLKELTGKVPGGDFQKIANDLEKELKGRGLSVPHILLSITRSYRHIRAKLHHDPREVDISPDETNALVEATHALINTLFEPKELNLDKNHFIQSILSRDIQESVHTFMSINSMNKKDIFIAIFDILIHNQSKLSWKDIEKYIAFLKNTIIAETDILTKRLLFKLFFDVTFIKKVNSTLKYEFLKAFCDLLKSAEIENLIIENNLIDAIVSDFVSSKNFYIPGKIAEILSYLEDSLENHHVEQIVNATIKNDNIHRSYIARPFLNKIFSFHYRFIPTEKRNVLNQILK